MKNYREDNDNLDEVVHEVLGGGDPFVTMPENFNCIIKISALEW